MRRFWIHWEVSFGSSVPEVLSAHPAPFLLCLGPLSAAIKAPLPPEDAGDDTSNLCKLSGEGIQGQAGCGSGQPGLLVGDPAHSRGLELDGHCGPFQPRPFYDSMVL